MPLPGFVSHMSSTSVAHCSTALLGEDGSAMRTALSSSCALSLPAVAFSAPSALSTLAAVAERAGGLAGAGAGAAKRTLPGGEED
jgi:hypothetical protein